MAAERLRAEGIDVRIVTVTDDVASGPADKHLQRRGIAGDFVVFKVAGAAAEAGLAIDEVERITRRANDRTFSFGVAFGGCTLPGSTEPLFTVPKGMMALGLGIHGEPGIRDTEIASASDLAKLLVDTILKERPSGARRAGVLLNGLGATKYEELFVLWGAVEKRLLAEGVELVAPECGEYVTSLDMQGCSLTVMWLDEELERFWLAPCDTPVFRRGATFSTEPTAFVAGPDEAELIFDPSSEASRKSAQCLAEVVDAIVDTLSKAEAELGRIDAFAGDGDHGQGMRRGATAAREAIHLAVSRGAGARSALAAAGDAWADRAGGTSGAIWGLMLRSWSSAFSDNTAAGSIDVVRGARLALDDVMRLGGAKPGDKTLVDSFVPFVEALEKATGGGVPLPQAWSTASEVCENAARATAPLRPRLGRARPLADRSVGHPDAGATSLAMIAKTIAALL